ncbi:MAG: hypothetical protein JRG83_07210 [Deltaproteobacteria bacterium]|nr:hypothetical protein [Deltaproteobacteria bacterium]
MIAPLLAGDVVDGARGTLLGGDPALRFSGVSIDTRTLEPGFLFFAIRGPNHDAHAFLANALEQGATGLVVEDAAALPRDLAPEVAAILVADTTQALGAVAAAHRAAFDGPVIAITGSNGKTTAKEMCASILGRSGPCLATRGNLNNEYGLPLTLLRRHEADRTAVVDQRRHGPHRTPRKPRGDRARKGRPSGRARPGRHGRRLRGRPPSAGRGRARARAARDLRARPGL